MRDIQHFFVAATCRYLNDLRNRQKGRIVLSIENIQKKNDLLYLYIRETVTHPESLKIEIHGEEIPPDYRFVLYDDYLHALVLSASAHIATLLLTTDVKAIRLVSDLYFLLERLQAWYEQNGSLLSFPPSGSNFPPVAASSIQLSEDQRQAVHTALSSPISYIWGAPGTGKTKAVLATCVLSYIANGLPILLTAPTNNAVDQMLRGVLEVLTASGINIDCVKRLGTPTQSFAREWPQVCQIGILDRLREKGIQLKNAQENLLIQQRHYARLHALQDDLSKLEQLFKHTFQTELILSLQQFQLSQISSAYDHTCEQLQSISFQIHWYMHAFHQAKRTFRRPFRHVTRRRSFPAFFHPSEKLQTLVRNRSALFAHLPMLSSLQDNAFLQQRFLHVAYEVCAANLQAFLHYISETYSLPLSGLTALEMYTSFSNYVASVQQEIMHALGPDVPSFQALQAELQYVTSQLERIRAEYKRLSSYNYDDQNSQQVLVRAATIDTLLQSVQPDEQICHVFLDEAGYCSLARGATLLAWNAPVTLLGDHMQLPPVYELSIHFQDKTTYAYIPFAQSILYLESLFVQDSATFFQNYFMDTPPVFSTIQVSALKYTYRYGISLAQALDTFVYHFALSSKASHETEIYTISVHSNSLNRASLPEANAIMQWCQSHPNEHAGILTPYRNQVKTLRNVLKQTNHRDEVYTIHRSQGREWDTVLLSVVDGAQYHFMMDSSIPKAHAQQSINTAVSRARKCLILVCDTEFWLHQPTQFLAALLRVAQPFIPPALPSLS